VKLLNHAIHNEQHPKTPMKTDTYKKRKNEKVLRD